MLLSLSKIIIHLVILLISFIPSSYSQTNTINKACAIGGSTCGTGQACINGICECDPAYRRFWTGDKHQCRVCPLEYIRQATRCYKYYSSAKNQSEARADCRKNQADLFTWRDNTDENELLKASTTQWNFNYATVKHQFYTWSGGMVHHGQGSRIEYKITWFDPKGPTIPHPISNDPLTDRYCNAMTKSNYKGDPEPTRRTKAGEKENCVTFVFLPQPQSRGQICMADDYCSTKMGYICELTEATLSGIYHTPPTPDRGGEEAKPESESTDNHGPTDEYENQQEHFEGPSAIEENNKSSLVNISIYVVGAIVFLVIIGIIVFIIMRKRKQNLSNMNISTRDSAINSVMSNSDVHEDV